MTKRSEQEAARPFRPKYLQIADAMKRDIREAGLAPHDSFLTDKSAGERYGASRITIRRAFAQLEEEGIVYRIRARGTMICAEPGRRIRIVAYIGQCVATNGIEPALVRGVEDYLAAHDTNVVICNTDNSPARANEHLRRLTDLGVDGVILIPMLAPPRENEALARFLRERGVPFVAVARSIPGMEREINSVAADNLSAGSWPHSIFFRFGTAGSPSFAASPWTNAPPSSPAAKGTFRPFMRRESSRTPNWRAMCRW